MLRGGRCGSVWRPWCQLPILKKKQIGIEGTTTYCLPLHCSFSTSLITGSRFCSGPSYRIHRCAPSHPDPEWFLFLLYCPFKTVSQLLLLLTEALQHSSGQWEECSGKALLPLPSLLLKTEKSDGWGCSSHRAQQGTAPNHHPVLVDCLYLDLSERTLNPSLYRLLLLK